MTMVSDIKKRSISKEIGILSRASHIFLQHQFIGYEIGHAQVMTLHFICRHNGISQHELVHFFNLDKSSVTSQLKKLEKNGYLIREIDPDDSRGKKLYITDKTKAIESDLYEKISSWSNLLLSGFDDYDRDKLFSLLDKMIANGRFAVDELKTNEEKK